jgi:hypothetical protein
MEVILSEVHYSHATTEANQVKSRRIKIPQKSRETILIGDDFQIELRNFSKPTCRWTSQNKTGKSKPGWNNQQFTIPTKERDVIQVLTVYRGAIDTPHQDH